MITTVPLRAAPLHIKTSRPPCPEQFTSLTCTKHNRMASPLPLTGINHISWLVADVQASRNFYRDVLGFEEIVRPDFGFEGAWLHRYSVGIHLLKGTPGPKSPVINPKDSHLSFQAACLSEVEALLGQLGVPFVKQTILEGGVTVQQLFFHDPDHNMIEVCNCGDLPVIPLAQQAPATPAPVQRSPTFQRCPSAKWPAEEIAGPQGQAGAGKRVNRGHPLRLGSRKLARAQRFDPAAAALLRLLQQFKRSAHCTLAASMDF